MINLLFDFNIETKSVEKEKLTAPAPPPVKIKYVQWFVFV
jgi:hypothetical protein